MLKKNFVLDLKELFKCKDLLNHILLCAVNYDEKVCENIEKTYWEYDEKRSMLKGDVYASFTNENILNTIKIFSSGNIHLLGGRRRMKLMESQQILYINNLNKIEEILSIFEKNNLDYIDLEKLYKSQTELQNIMKLALNWVDDKDTELRKYILTHNTVWIYYRKCNIICGYIYSIFNDEKKDRVLKIYQYGDIKLLTDDEHFPFKNTLKVYNMDMISNVLRKFKVKDNSNISGNIDLKSLLNDKDTLDRIVVYSGCEYSGIKHSQLNWHLGDEYNVIIGTDIVNKYIFYIYLNADVQIFKKVDHFKFNLFPIINQRIIQSLLKPYLV